jgi:hypothetical protein
VDRGLIAAADAEKLATKLAKGKAGKEDWRLFVEIASERSRRQ